MADKKVRIVPLNSGVLTGISLEELEDRLELQMLGLSDTLAVASVVTSGHPCPVTVITSSVR